MDKVDENIETDGFMIHCHRLRKTFATKLLDHIDIKMTMIYLEIDNTMLEQHYNQFYPYKKSTF